MSNAPLIRPKRGRASKPTKKTVPSLRFERELWDAGKSVVVGVDEVGRGAWAGPLTVGAAVVPQDRRVNGIRDSKLLSEAEREFLFDRIANWCEAWAVGHATQVECDAIGMAAAQRLAARRAIEGLGVVPEAVLIDGSWDFVGLGNTQRLIKGDAHCLSIAAASILAKVTRDRIMREYATAYPLYNFENNKGYPCPRQQMALRAYGPSVIHRRSWAFTNSLPWGLQVLDDQDDEEMLEAEAAVADVALEDEISQPS